MVKDIKKYAYIDALRGLAIFGVLLVHSSQQLKLDNTLLGSFLPLGARGVQLFYIASALTLCMSWDSRKKHEQYPIRNFLSEDIFE